MSYPIRGGIMVLTLWPATVELTTLLRECGFAGVEVCGDLAGSAYDHMARRLVALARR